MYQYEASDNQLFLVHDFTGEQSLVATCDRAGEAAALLNKSMRLNAARKYTASARMMAQAAGLPGFIWLTAAAE